MRIRRPSLAVITLTVLALAAGGAVSVALRLKQQRQKTQLATTLTGGDPSLGPGLMLQYGCAGCHEVRGVRGPGGRVGPPLTTMAERVYIAGMLTNTPDHLVSWIVNPKEVNPRTAMPVTGISRAEARHVVAYLLSL